MRHFRVVAFLVLLTSWTFAQPAPDTADAWPLYKRAIDRIHEGDQQGKTCPAASNLEYSGYPPFPAEWERMEKAAYEFNASALADVRKATSIKSAKWPHELVEGHIDRSYLSGVRNLANQVGDAALYEHVHGKEASAFYRLADLWHLAELLDGKTPESTLDALVGIGVRALVLYRMQVIASEIRIAEKASADGNAVLASDVQAWIRSLFSNNVNFDARVQAIAATDLAMNPPPPKEKLIAGVTRQVQREQSERNLTAMVLACRLFHFQKHRWPASLDELATLLPAKPVDAWGAMGYAVVKNGTPTGDRPLVYSRANAPEGAKLEYPLAEPQFGFYGKLFPDERVPPGQFRDVTLWAPAKRQTGDPTLKPLD